MKHKCNNHENNNNESQTANPHRQTGWLRGLFNRIRLRKRQRRLSRVQRGLDTFARRLHLNVTQQDGLGALFSDFETLVKTSRQGKRSGFTQFSAATQTEFFDVELAQNAVHDNLATVRNQMNVTLAHFGEWFATLDQAQRETFRCLVQKRLGIA